MKKDTRDGSGLTVGVDLGDRWSRYCVLDAAGRDPRGGHDRHDRPGVSQALRRPTCGAGGDRGRDPLAVGPASAAGARARDDHGQSQVRPFDLRQQEQERPAGCGATGSPGPGRYQAAAPDPASWWNRPGRSCPAPKSQCPGRMSHQAGQSRSRHGEVDRRSVAELLDVVLPQARTPRSSRRIEAGIDAGARHDRGTDKEDPVPRDSNRALGIQAVSGNRAAAPGLGRRPADGVELRSDAWRTRSDSRAAVPWDRIWACVQDKASPAIRTPSCESRRPATRICGGCWSARRITSWDRLDLTPISDVGDSHWRREGRRTRRSVRSLPWRASWQCCCTDCGSRPRSTSLSGTTDPRSSRRRSRHETRSNDRRIGRTFKATTMRGSAFQHSDTPSPDDCAKSAGPRGRRLRLQRPD